MHSTDRCDNHGSALLQLARRSIEHGLIHSKPWPVELDALPRELTEHHATFTTLRLDGELRGCRGSLVAERPLGEDVSLSAFQAAFEDPRFNPLRDHELEPVSLEVSVLSTMEPFPVADEAELLERLAPGIDGLVLIAGLRRATFLPTVWDQLPEPDRFVGALKLKAGLSRDYWSDDIEFQRYTTASYAEQT